MFGVRYEVTPKDGHGEPWQFESDLSDECVWEQYASKHRLPILPDTSDRGAGMSGFPMLTNAAVLAWSHSGTSEGFDSWRRKQARVMPADEQADAEGLPDPTAPGPGPG